MSNSIKINPALCIDRGGVPHIEADMACDIFASINNTTNYFCQSYFDALTLVTPCKVTKRDALTELGIRSYDIHSRKSRIIKQSSFSSKHILLPRSPLYPIAGGLPTAEAGPSQDLIQGRVVMTIEKWKEVVAATKPDFVSPLCELIAIQEVLALPSRKRQSLTTRNEKWMKETMAALAAQSSSSCVFPLGTHFHYVKENNNNNNNKQDDACALSSSENVDASSTSLATKVGINDALYEQWCSLFSTTTSSASSTTRIVSLLCLGSGETPEQRRQFLQDIFAALVVAETKVKTANTNNNLPPLQLLVGSVSDKSMIEEIKQVFFSPSSSEEIATTLVDFSREIICLSCIVPSSLAAGGMALQKNQGSTSFNNNNNENKQQQEEAVTTQRRDRDDESTNEIRKLSNKPSTSIQINTTPASFDVINLWDADFKFSKVPLCDAKIVVASSCGKGAAAKNETTAALSASCPCYACERHTAGYFHHLLDVHEMNAEILLSVHNYTQWFSYLKN